MSMTFTMHAPPREPETPLSLTLDAKPRFSIEAVDYDANKIDDMIAKIKYHGCVRVKGFLRPDEIRAAEAAVRPALDAAHYAGADDQTKRLGRLPQHAPRLTTRILTDEVYTGVMDAFLSVRHMWWVGSKRFVVDEKPVVAMSSLFEVGPGMHAQDLHHDDSIWYSKRPEVRPKSTPSAVTAASASSSPAPAPPAPTAPRVSSRGVTWTCRTRSRTRPGLSTPSSTPATPSSCCRAATTAPGPTAPLTRKGWCTPCSRCNRTFVR